MANTEEQQVDILQMHDLRPAPGAKKDRTRVGRGEGSKGKTSGRGTKGTKARYQVRPGFEGGQMPLYMRLPKLRGFKNPFKKQFQVVNLSALSELFPKGGDVDVEALVAKGAVRSGFAVKVLGEGEVSAPFTLKGVKSSASAKAKIEAAGGSISED
ncbi:50S ribosomal protein L15 [Bifidobacterium sp.]|jgi:large subunit ribosomal protein L15|uniref:50S ribosomal protein L15 n=1 Tax=Bifidobacterium sp. TaxID=41200 RepID=UPI0025B88316|nr:50S ribosomal protein L15 [Bifidobacterium sp.]MCH4175791.1 50S ribosomal protein L15 [Bifidobacterium sp.]MCI1635302.1 50S ribosomal protein L15 [Bifidobacterium sp.]